MSRKDDSLIKKKNVIPSHAINEIVLTIRDGIFGTFPFELKVKENILLIDVIEIIMERKDLKIKFGKFVYLIFFFVRKGKVLISYHRSLKSLGFEDKETVFFVKPTRQAENYGMRFFNADLSLSPFFYMEKYENRDYSVKKTMEVEYKSFLRRVEVFLKWFERNYDSKGGKGIYKLNEDHKVLAEEYCRVIRLCKSSPQNYSLKVMDKNPFHWRVSILGMENSPYSGYKILFDIKFLYILNPKNRMPRVSIVSSLKNYDYVDLLNPFFGKCKETRNELEMVKKYGFLFNIDKDLEYKSSSLLINENWWFQNKLLSILGLVKFLRRTTDTQYLQKFFSKDSLHFQRDIHKGYKIITVDSGKFFSCEREIVKKNFVFNICLSFHDVLKRKDYIDCLIKLKV